MKLHLHENPIFSAFELPAEGKFVKLKDTIRILIDKIPDNRIIFTGIWSIPVSFGTIVAMVHSWGHGLTICGYLLAALCAMTGGALITAIHIYQYLVWGKRKFTFRSALHNAELPSRRKQRASHPEVPEKYLSHCPTGYVLGRVGNQYVRILPSTDSFCGLLCSTPGSGKSVTIMASLIENFCLTRAFTVVATDPKGELSEKFSDLPNVKIISLTDREQHGYNIFYWYEPGMSDEELEKHLKVIAEALVSDAGGKKNEYFWANARKMLTGLMAWMIRQGKNFPEIMTDISTHNVMALIEQALEETDSKLVKKMLSAYSGKTGEDIESITTEVTTAIDVFAASSSMDWSLAESPRMVTPYDTAWGNSIFLSIEQERIEEFAPFIRLFYAQMFQYLLESRENNVTSSQTPIWFVLEEAPLYGAIPHLDSFLSTCRSKKISVYIVCQAISQLENAYGKEKANTILDDSLVKVVLGVANNETAEYFSKMTGQYEEDRTSTQTHGLLKLPNAYSYSQERRKCMDPEDFFRLKDTNSAVLFIDGNFMQVTKVKYYEDRELSALMRHREIQHEAAVKRKNEAKINESI